MLDEQQTKDDEENAFKLNWYQSVELEKYIVIPGHVTLQQHCLNPTVFLLQMMMIAHKLFAELGSSDYITSVSNNVALPLVICSFHVLSSNCGTKWEEEKPT